MKTKENELVLIATRKEKLPKQNKKNKCEEGNHISVFIRKWKILYTCVFVAKPHEIR